MSEGTSKLSEWADSDREQAEAIRYLAAIGVKDAHSSLSSSQAENLDATADGWAAVAAAADVSSGEVEDPDA